jgi:hypothetical protein
MSTINNTIITRKFKSISLIDTGILVKPNAKEQHTILFSEMRKIYIRKLKFSSFNKLIIAGLMCILMVIYALFMPIEIVAFTLLLFIPLIVKMNNYKKYELHVCLNNETYLIKKINKESRNMYINMVNIVRKEIFRIQITSNYIDDKIKNVETIVEEFSHENLSVV